MLFDGEVGDRQSSKGKILEAKSARVWGVVDELGLEKEKVTGAGRGQTREHLRVPSSSIGHFCELTT